MAHHMEIGSGDDLLSVPLLNQTPSEDQTTQQEGDEEMVHVIQIEATDGQAPPPKVIETPADHELENYPAEPCIFRVHDGLRKSNPDAYTPMLISIGPYHRGKEKLKAMEVHKKRYLGSFVDRGEHSEESYRETLKGLKTKARAYYADPIGLDDDEEFVDMLLLDGSFIVEFVRKCSESGPKPRDDPIFNVDWMRHQVCRDLLLFENQLPYFILSELYDKIKDPNTQLSFKEMVKWAFSSVLPKLCPFAILIDLNDPREIKHLLHVVHVSCQPLSDEGRSDEVHVCCQPLSDEGRSDGNNTNSNVLLDQMRSVTELQEAGVSFKTIGKIYAGVDEDNFHDSVSLFDIKFTGGVMEIPSFIIEDSTESFFRNLIAYEQHSSDVYPTYFSDYASFMDQLINTSNDVTVLRLKGVVMNLLGDDELVARLFNKLGEGVMTSSGFYYSGVCNRVNKHCERLWNVVMAKLRHDYFSSPWAGISTAAAIVLLFVTVAQTVATFMTL